MSQLGYVVLKGDKKVMFSAPHAVEQTRDGKIKYAETETGEIARTLNAMGYPCIIKTQNLGDDANFDLESDYKKVLVEFVRTNGIEAVIDLHELSPNREQAICLGTGGEECLNLLGSHDMEQQLKEHFQQHFEVVSVNIPFGAKGEGTISRYISSRCNIPCVQIEMNCKLFIDKMISIKDMASIIEQATSIFKKKILLISNASLEIEKIKEQNKMLFEASTQLNCELSIKNNVQVYSELANGNLPYFDAVLFYDKDILLAKKLELLGFKLFNNSEAVENCDNKAKTQMCLEKYNIPTPKTIVAPLIFYYDQKYYTDFVNHLVDNLGLPLIAKEWFGSWGEQVYLLNSKQEILNLIDKKQGKELLFQEYIEECKGRDIRINIVNKKVVASMKRINNQDFRANISNGGYMEKYEPTEQEINLALKASECVGCDFCGVDILQSNKGPLVCEINSNAHLINIYKCTGENVAKDILQCILSHKK